MDSSRFHQPYNMRGDVGYYRNVRTGEVQWRPAMQRLRCTWPGVCLCVHGTTTVAGEEFTDRRHATPRQHININGLLAAIFVYNSTTLPPPIKLWMLGKWKHPILKELMPLLYQSCSRIYLIPLQIPISHFEGFRVKTCSSITGEPF